MQQLSRPARRRRHADEQFLTCVGCCRGHSPQPAVLVATAVMVRVAYVRHREVSPDDVKLQPRQVLWR
jgi:hypothetical protein